LILEFSAISDYFSNSKARYRYRIIGLNENWIDVGFKREITLANLSPGEYKLQVNATNNDGNVSDDLLELAIIVKPEFWQTTWFAILMILLSISVIISFVGLRIKFLRDNNIRLENIVKVRTQELEESKKELEIANATKNKFFSIIAHDLKNPFNALLNYSDILLTDYNILTEDEKIQFITGIKDSSESTYKFLQNLLTWARTQTDKIQYNPKTINIDLALSHCFKVLEVISNNKKIKLISSVHEDKFVYADENMLNTIFMNLLSNAIKFSEENKSVFVSIEKEDENSITISVRDEGIGMKETDKAKLFKIDEYHSTAGTKGETGTGIGLIITYEFMKSNKGKIEVESKLGKGTEFFLTFPKSST